MPRKSSLVVGNAQEATTAKAVDGRRTAYTVKGCPGLMLEVLPQVEGGKDPASWRFIYRVVTTKGPVKRTMLIGTRRDLPIADARVQADTLRIRVAKGEDPAVPAAVPAADPIEAMTLRDWFERRQKLDGKPSSATMLEYRRLVFSNAAPLLDQAVDAIADIQVARLLDKVAERSPHQADRTRDALRSTFRWGIGRKLVKANPATGHDKRAVEIPRSRWYTDAELARIIAAIAARPQPMSTILMLLLLTGQRLSMVAGAQVAELDLDKALWTIAGDTSKGGRRIKGRMKKGLEQVVPLSQQAHRLFATALEHARDDCFFPADLGRVPHDRGLSRTLSINPHSVTRAMARLLLRLAIDDGNTRDFRRTIAAWLSEREVRPDVIDAILAHKPKDVGGIHYQKRAPLTLIRAALQLWADYVSELQARSAQPLQAYQANAS